MRPYVQQSSVGIRVGMGDRSYTGPIVRPKAGGIERETFHLGQVSVACTRFQLEESAALSLRDGR